MTCEPFIGAFNRDDDANGRRGGTIGGRIKCSLTLVSFGLVKYRRCAKRRINAFDLENDVCTLFTSLAMSQLAGCTLP
jgi:hypothetical protein